MQRYIRNSYVLINAGQIKGAHSYGIGYISNKL